MVKVMKSRERTCKLWEKSRKKMNLRKLLKLHRGYLGSFPKKKKSNKKTHNGIYKIGNMC